MVTVYILLPEGDETMGLDQGPHEENVYSLNLTTNTIISLK